MSQTCIVIGASHAAAQLSASLRQEGWSGRILVIGNEQSLPYQRPPLSKAYLSGDVTDEGLLIRKPAFFDQKQIEFLLGVSVTHIDRTGKTIQLSTGEQLTYDKLALCTGARVRQLGLPGETLPGVHYLRTLSDVEHIRADVQPAKSAVIIGGGYIGLEAAASLTKLGMRVTVLEAESRVLARVTAPEVSAFYTRIHQQEGVQIITETTVTALRGERCIESVECSDGRSIAADMVVIGVGVIVNDELAKDANLTVDNGVVVDEFAQTSDPDIVAAGDVTSHFNGIYERRLRLESVPNATEQAKTAAASLCGKAKPYCTLPWFWSDQYDLKLQIAGLNQGYDRLIIRGDIENSRSFAAFYLCEGRLIAADCVNRPAEFMAVKKSLTTGAAMDVEKLADETVAAKELFL